MGFSIYEFQDQYDSNGNHKLLVEQKQYADIDGQTELIWEVVSERVVLTAQQYFNAPGLTGLPLLGDNQLGESQSGSHWGEIPVSRILLHACCSLLFAVCLLLAASY